MPVRIISLVPSLTELLFDLGLSTSDVVGRTKFCIHPKSIIQQVPKIGGTKNVRIDAVKDLRPDLIIANKEENVKEQIEALQKEFPLLLTNIKNYNDAMDAIDTISNTINKSEKGITIIDEIEQRFNNILQKQKPIKVCYLIWQNPMMTIGKDTFIHDMLEKANFVNIYGDLNRYPEIDESSIQSRNPDVIMLSSEPYPFKDKHLVTIAQQIGVPTILVDGELFSWYGSRMKQFPSYAENLYQKIKMLLT